MVEVEHMGRLFTEEDLSSAGTGGPPASWPIMAPVRYLGAYDAISCNSARLCSLQARGQDSNLSTRL